jgi:hypothetical protein
MLLLGGGVGMMAVWILGCCWCLVLELGAKCFFELCHMPLIVVRMLVREKTCSQSRKSGAKLDLSTASGLQVDVMPVPSCAKHRYDRSSYLLLSRDSYSCLFLIIVVLAVLLRVDKHAPINSSGKSPTDLQCTSSSTTDPPPASTRPIRLHTSKH